MMEDNRDFATRLGDASSFFLTGRNPNDERIAAAQKQESDAESRKNKIQLEASLEALKIARESGMNEEEFVQNLPQVADVLNRNGVPISSLRIPGKKDDVKFNTDIGKGFQDIDALESQAVEAEKKGNSKRADELMQRAEMLREQVLKSANEDPEVEFRDLGDRVGIFSKSGELLRAERKGSLRAPKEPTNTILNLKLPDNTIQSLRADDPRVDELLNQGAIVTSRGGSGLSVEMGPDGRVSAIRTGDAATVGTSGQFEREIAKIDETVLNIMDLSQRLREEDLGIKGVLGEFFVDKLAAQFKPSLADPTRVQNRAFLRALRESSLRQVSSDNRFNAQDRAAIEAILPEDGVFESLPDARGKLEMLAIILRDRARIRGGMINRKPITAMSPVEIRDALEAKQIDKVTAIRTLKFLHGGLSGN